MSGNDGGLVVEGSFGRLETHLRARRDAGKKLLVPYVTGGLGTDWLETLEAVVVAGADAVEVGIPFSDPVMDGPVIQEASELAIRGGATPASVIGQLAAAEFDVPIVVMTYYNIGFRMGLHRFASRLADAGISGAILPDLPLEESGPWCEAADEGGIETILLAAPTAPDDRLPRICERARGFVYGVGLLGTTGVRDELAASAAIMGDRLRAVTDRPVLIGVGVGTPEQATQLVDHADGVVVGSAVVHQMLSGGGPDAVGALVAEFRAALDEGSVPTPPPA